MVIKVGRDGSDCHQDASDVVSVCSIREASGRYVHGNRKIGLGVMGWADMCKLWLRLRQSAQAGKE